MFLGPPLPLTPALPLSALLAHAFPPGSLGAWVRGSAPRLRLYSVPHPGCCRVLASSDLGILLARCNRVLVREGTVPVVLEAETLIRWRALQVATATPYLPGLERLRELFPGLRRHRNGVLIPLRASSPEEVLAGCLELGLPVTGSRIVYSAADTAPRGNRD